MKNAVILKMGGRRRKEPRTGSAPEPKEKKRIIREISEGPVDTDTGVGAEKDVEERA